MYTIWYLTVSILLDEKSLDKIGLRMKQLKSLYREVIDGDWTRSNIRHQKLEPMGTLDLQLTNYRIAQNFEGQNFRGSRIPFIVTPSLGGRFYSQSQQRHARVLASRFWLSFV